MVYQYTYGDRYKNLQDKKQLEQAQIQTYTSSYLSPELAKKTIAIKQYNPYLSPGVVASLAMTDASPEDVSKASLEQTRINAQNDKQYTGVPNSLSHLTQQALLGKAFGMIGEGIKGGMDKVQSGLNRTLRFIFQTWEMGIEELYSRRARANVMLTGELEGVLQQQGLSDLESQRIGSLYNIIGLVTPTQADRNALTNALGKLIARKEFSIPDTFNEQKQLRLRKEAGGSGLEQVLRLISEEAGLNPDKFIKNIPDAYKKLGPSGLIESYDRLTGTQIIPQGIAEEQAKQLKEANLYRGRTITQGRYISDSVFGIENPTVDFWVSGLIDAAALFAVDPANLVGVGRKSLRVANRTLNEIKKLQKAGKLDDARQLARDIIKRDTSEDVLKIILNDKSPDKFVKLVQANKDPIFSLKLLEAENIDDMLKITEDSILNGTNWNGPSFNGTKIIPDWINNAGYKALRDKQSKAKGTEPLTTLGKYLPEQEVNLENITETIDTLINYGALAKADASVVNNVAINLTKALQDRRFYLAQKILIKDFYGHLIKKYSKNKGTYQGYLQWADETIKTFRKQNVAYTAGDGVATRAVKRKGVGAGNERFFDVPFPYQVMENTFYFTPFRDVKRVVNTLDQVGSRALSKLGRYTDDTFGEGTALGDFFKSLSIKVSDLDLPLPKTFTAGSDALWKGQMIWSSAMLPTRLAYPTRLSLEGYIRAYLYGFDTPLNAPFAYLGSLFFDKTDVLGNTYKKGGWSKRQLEDSLQKAVGNRRLKEVGSRGQRYVYQENFNSVFYGDEIFENSDLMNRAVESLRIQYAAIYSNEISQLVADYTINNKSLRELAERFYSGDKKQLWDDFTSTLIADEVPETLDDALLEIKALQEQLITLTGGNTEFLESFATRIYRNVDLNSLARRTTENSKIITNGIEEMLRTSGTKRPVDIPSPRELIDSKSYKDYLKTMDRDGFKFWDAMWHFSSAFEANLIRIPFFKQLVNRSLADDLIIADEKALKTLFNRFNKLPRKLKNELISLHPEISKGYENFAALTAKNNLPKISLEAMDARAKQYALNESTRIFYNLSLKGQTADALRFVFPFFEAFKEVMFSLGKGFVQKPDALLKATHGIKAGEQNGIVYDDPLSGDKYVAVPLPDFVARKWLGAGAEKLNVSVTVPLSGFNLVGATLLPGVGPVAAVAIGAFSGQLKKLLGRDTYKLIVPYGTPIEDLEELAPDGIPTILGNIYTPTYLKSFISAAQVGISGELDSLLQDDAVASRALDSVKIVSLNEPQPLQTEKDFEEFDKKVLNNVAARLSFEGFAKLISPSPPRLLYQTEFDVDAKNVPQDLKKFTEAVLGDMDLGKVTTKDAKSYVSIGVLALFYSELRQQMTDEYGAEDGEFLAWLTFTRMTGIESITDLEGKLKATDQVNTAPVLKQGKYDSLDGKLPRTVAERDFKDNNPEVVDKYEETYLYLMDDIHIKGELDSTLFFEQLNEDSIKAIDPAMMVIESQEFLYNLCYDNATKYYKGDYSANANNARREAANYCDDAFPLGNGDTDINLKKLLDRDVEEKRRWVSDWNTKMDELEEMSKDESLQNYPVYPALNSYFAARDLILFSLAQESETLTYPQNKETLEDSLRNPRSESAQYYREQLREVANRLLSEYPEFYSVYDEVLSFEIKYNKTYNLGD